MAHFSDGCILDTDSDSGLKIFCVLFLYVTEHFDCVQSKSERITWGPLANLAWNDPAS